MIFSATYSRLLVSGTLPRSPEVFETGLPVMLPKHPPHGQLLRRRPPIQVMSARVKLGSLAASTTAESQTQWPLEWGFFGSLLRQ
jgi:hypothetical protein